LLAFTVTVVLLLTVVLVLVELKLAVIVLDPRFLPVTRPLVVIETVPLADELHAVTLVTSCCVLSAKVTVAFSCWLLSSGRLGLAGVIARLIGATLFTVRVAVPDINPEVAVIVTLPEVTPVASPEVGTLELIVATPVLEELHVTLDVMFCWLLSL
jgi:hypothetical protein